MPDHTSHYPESVARDMERVMRAALNARAVRACLLTTRDREYAIMLAEEQCTAMKIPLYHFTLAERRIYNPEKLIWRTTKGESAEAWALIQGVLDIRGPGMVILEDLVPFLRDDGGDTRLRMEMARLLSKETRVQGIVLLFLEPPESEKSLPAMLADQFVRLDIAYPRAAELDTIAKKELVVALQHRGRTVDMDVIRGGARKLASGLAGMTRSAARDALRDALADDPSDLESASARLQARKAAKLSRELAMNVLETTDVEEPVGLDYLLEYLEIIKDKISLTGPERAKGILLVGPPGTGKTMLARAVGHIVNLPVVEFKISALMNSLLGETERRFAQAFATLEAMAPNVVFIDEIEKAFGDSSERDGGTMMRCTGSLLSWLSDNPYPNFIVATSNSLTRMGEIGLTMTRSERFDASFFVDVPCYDSRRRILSRLLAGKVDNAEQLAARLADKTEKFSGADLYSLVKHAVSRAQYRGCELDMGLLETEIERKRKKAHALYEEFQGLRRWGLLYCDPAGPYDNGGLI